MSTLFKKPSELSVTPTIKVLIYGQPGVGKSSLALSAPQPVLFDFDGGVQRVNSAFQCPTLQVNSWEEAIAAVEELRRGEVPCQSIVIDTAGKMLDYMADSIIRNNRQYLKKGGGLTLPGYGVRKAMFVNFIKTISVMGKHLVFVAHEREEKDGENKTVRPEIGGSSAGDLIKELDLVGYMEMTANGRTVGWSPDPKYYAKNTCNLPAKDAVGTIIDNEGRVVGENNFLTNVFNKYMADLSRQRQQRKRYDDLLTSFRKGVESVTDADSANNIFTKIESYDKHVWDSKAQAERALQAKCQSLGLKFNTIDNKYESAA